MPSNQEKYSIQSIIFNLQQFWSNYGCAVLQPYDIEMGAGTFHPATTLRSLGPEPWKAAYVQPSRRPTDGRYGKNPNRVQQFFQFQVIIKPSPASLIDIYLESLNYIGIDTKKHEIRFIEDNWESPTVGAWGLGWEAWCDGMEITQITYFQHVGGYDCNPVSGELAYGLERIAMYLQQTDNFFDLNYNGKLGSDKITYKDIFLQSEKENSAYNFEYANITTMLKQFELVEQECLNMCKTQSNNYFLAIPAYDQCIKASHIFNILDSRNAISVTERQSYILRIREMAHQCATAYLKNTKANDQ